MSAQTYLSYCLILTISVINIKPVYLIPQCPVHEFYNTAASLCTPEPTCQNPTPYAKHGCVEDYCQQRCECSEGYIRDETKHGKCVPISDCPCTAQCPVHEFYNTAASLCTPEPTCQNPTPYAKHGCVEDYCQQRCECNEGYIRDETKNGKCVPISECPCTAQCPVHEFYNTAASLCTPEPTCQNPTPYAKHGCVEDYCQQRCECNEGYIRDDTKNGKCIPINECQCTVCGENEVFNECASSCDIEPTCDNQTPEVDPCCEPKSIQRCECAPGYVRDPNGKCICTTSCPCCDPLTENLCCKPCCEVTCQHPEGWNCRKDCCEDVCELGCVCKDHYTRDEKTGKCVAVCYHDILVHKPRPHHPRPHLGRHHIL